MGDGPSNAEELDPELGVVRGTLAEARRHRVKYPVVLAVAFGVADRVAASWLPAKWTGNAKFYGAALIGAGVVVVVSVIFGVFVVPVRQRNAWKKRHQALSTTYQERGDQVEQLTKDNTDLKSQVKTLFEVIKRFQEPNGPAEALGGGNTPPSLPVAPLDRPGQPVARPLPPLPGSGHDNDDEGN